jgi:hypothetical protein
MTIPVVDRLMICFISSLDFRRINQGVTPYLAGAISAYPWARINTIPETDLVPTVFTGVYPHEHGVWQVKLNYSRDSKSTEKFIDFIPDIVTTTCQCLIHLITGSFDLAAVPPWRRKRYEIYKTRFMKRNVRAFLNLNDKDTIFSVVGEKESNYAYNQRFDELYSTINKLCFSKYRLELFESHSLDTLQHWYLDNIKKVSEGYQLLDRFLEDIHSKCKMNGITLMIISDHGQEPVKGSIDIVKELNKLRIPRYEFTYYIEAPKARFFFHTDRAREKILEMLNSLEHGTILSYIDLYKYNVKFTDDSYGEYYFIADPGYILFPHDFYHPLGNLFLGLTEELQRSRLTSPKYRGYHGYLPHNESEKGLMILLDDRYKPQAKEIEVIDIAPTILALLGYNKPDFMKGMCALNL